MGVLYRLFLHWPILQWRSSCWLSFSMTSFTLTIVTSKMFHMAIFCNDNMIRFYHDEIRKCILTSCFNDDVYNDDGLQWVFLIIRWQALDCLCFGVSWFYDEAFSQWRLFAIRWRFIYWRCFTMCFSMWIFTKTCFCHWRSCAMTIVSNDALDIGDFYEKVSICWTGKSVKIFFVFIDREKKNDSTLVELRGHLFSFQKHV